MVSANGYIERSNAAKESWNKWLSRSRKILLALIAIPLIYLLFALILGLTPVNSDFQQPEEGVQIYVSTNGAHADLVVPSRSDQIDWSAFFPLEEFIRVDTGFKYIAFGWGERNFYLNTPTWDDLTIDVALHALFWPSAAAMHVDHLKEIPTNDPDYVKITISEEQYLLLIEHIKSGFIWDDEMPVLIKDASYWNSDNFYEAKGRYHVFKTSNTWTAQGLRKAGVRTAVWSPFDRAIMYHARSLSDDYS